MTEYTVFIITHARAHNQVTYPYLRSSGCTQKIWLIVDDRDPELEDYKREYAEDLLVYSKDDVTDSFDHMDNFNNYLSATYSRMFAIKYAQEHHINNFVVFDDDLRNFSINYIKDNRFKGKEANIDNLFSLIFNYLNSTKIKVLGIVRSSELFPFNPEAIAVNNDSRIVMCTYFFSSEKPIKFFGTRDEDSVTSYLYATEGDIFLSLKLASCATLDGGKQAGTLHSTKGGLFDAYKTLGSYVFHFYNILARPDATNIKVKNGVISLKRFKNNLFPKIIDEKFKK